MIPMLTMIAVTTKDLIARRVAVVFQPFVKFTAMVKIDYESKVKGKVQRPSRKGVGPSGPKRLAPRTGDDMVCSAWEHAAAR